MTSSRKNVGKTRGRPFETGNPGRPKGTRNKVTRAVETLLEGEADALTRKAVEMALDGDTTALRLCLERLCPPRREHPISVKLPTLKTAEDTANVIAFVLAAVAAGEITPGEGRLLAAMVESARKAIETGELERRLVALEKHPGIRR